MSRPTPPRQPMVPCPHCGTPNDPARGSTRCVSCNLPLNGSHSTNRAAPAGLSIRERLERLSAPSGDCRVWQGGTDRHGYPEIKIGGRRGKRMLAHRVSYAEHVGAIPEGMEIDHTCHNRICVNPAHLEPVTGEENIRRAMAFYGPQWGRRRAA